MPALTTTKPTALPNGPEQYEYVFTGGISFRPTGVLVNRSVVLRKFAANLDGSNPLETAAQKVVPLSGPNLTPNQQKCADAIQAAIQQLITDEGL